MLTSTEAKAAAKRAYRTFKTTGVKEPGFTEVIVGAYIYVCDGWEFTLNNNGIIDSVIKARYFTQPELAVLLEQVSPELARLLEQVRHANKKG